MPKDTPQVDHKAEALRLLEIATENFEHGHLRAAEHQRQKALVHSNLAIAEGQDRVAEATEAANQDRRERRASAVEDLRTLVGDVLSGEAGDPGDWNPRARKTLALFEAAEHV